MICRVVERALAASTIQRAIVATDDARIVQAVELMGYEALLTRVDHKSGTDRIAEVAASLPEAEVIVNVQGDEPLISPETIDWAVNSISTSPSEDSAGIVTSWEPIQSASEVLSPDVVKIVVDENERALYFSRSPVPYPRDLVRQYGSLENALENEPSLVGGFRKHTGLYVYRRDVLLAFTTWPQSELERTESLEQLRALEHGVTIKAVRATGTSVGVDTMEDLERVRAGFEMLVQDGPSEPRRQGVKVDCV
jgi:3-deoxy-manno-octulosonate cytidylyltransferase (CMP-KDO synthetase)